MKKGYFFTLDAVIAVGIILGTLALFSSFGQTQQPIAHLNFFASDLIAALDDFQFFELGAEAYNIINNATKSVDTNQSVLAVIGELWANGDITIAEQLAEFTIEEKVPANLGVGIWMDDEQIYARTSPSPTIRASARKIVSGLTKARPTKGFIARANAQDITRTTAKIISFAPEGAGWYGSSDNPGKALIDKYFEVPANATLINASLAISLHMHTTGSDWDVVTLGNCTITRDEIASSGQGFYDIKNITGCLVPGTNHIHLDLRNTAYNGHIHPGMWLQMNFRETTSVPLYTTEISKRIYFDNITSVKANSGSSGVWQVLPFHIPPEATNVSASMQIVGTGIRDYNGWNWFSSWRGWRRRRDYDYVVFVNENDYFDRDKKPSTNEVYNYDSSQLGPKLVDGTNVVVAYFNNYGDTRWGNQDVSIYSDPINDPDGSSYVELNYTLPSDLPYGHIEIGVVNESGGSEYYRKTASFSFPANSIMGDVFAHVAQRFSYLVRVGADSYNPPTTIVFDSPASRAVPSEIFVPTTTLSGSPTATNFVRMTDRNYNKLLPQSSAEYRFYLPSFVGYGDVFATQAEATDDATLRLEALLQPYISSGSIEVDASSITDVPTLWGPTIAEVRVWR